MFRDHQGLARCWGAIAAIACLAVFAPPTAAEAHSGPAPACTDNFTGPSGGDWATASNWTMAVGGSHTVPGAGDVACWPAGTVVTADSGDDTAGSIQGGELDLGGSYFALANAAQPSTLVNFDMSAAGLSGPGSLSVSGNISFTGGEISYFAPISTTQTGGGSFTISGSNLAYFNGGSVNTTSPVTITNTDFVLGDGGTFTTTG